MNNEKNPKSFQKKDRSISYAFALFFILLIISIGILLLVLWFIIPIPDPGEPSDLSMLITIIIISIVVPVSGISIYIGVKHIMKKRRYYMERLLNKCIDISNLNYLIVTDSKSTLVVYIESYGDKKLDSTLISGFLQAVREFGTHVAEKDTRIGLFEEQGIKSVNTEKGRISVQYPKSFDSGLFGVEYPEKKRFALRLLLHFTL